MAASALALQTQLASAEPSPQDRGAARALFETGKARLSAGDWQGACEKFDKSLALDVNVSTLIKVARCRANDGKLASAGEAYERALSLNRDGLAQSAKRRADLAATIERELDLLRPRIPRLRIVVVDAPPGLALSRNGQPIPTSVLGEALPVDPGDYEISAAADGFATDNKKVSINERKSADEVVEISLRLLKAPAPAAASPKSVAEPPPLARASAAPPSSEQTERRRDDASHPPPTDRSEPADRSTGGGTQRTLGFAVGGLGIAGLGVGGFYGLRTLSLVDDSNPYCDHPGGTCERRGVMLRRSAGHMQTTGIAFAAAGGALVITGVTLVLTADSGSTASVSLGPTSVLGSLSW